LGRVRPHTAFFASTHSPIPTRQFSPIGGFDAVAPHTSIVLFVSSCLLFKTKFLFFYLNKSEAGTNNEVWRMEQKPKVYKTIQKCTKLYIWTKNVSYGVFEWQIVTNLHLFKPFLTLLDLGGCYGHKMCVFPQEYELFPY
jgi:hypothetical protein